MIIVADKPPNYPPSIKDFVGNHSRVFDRMLSHAGVARSDVSVVWASEGPFRLPPSAVVVCAGEAAAKAVLGWDAPPQRWHGSVFPAKAKPPLGWSAYTQWCTDPAQVVVTHAIDKLCNMFEWHPLAARDWWKAGQVQRGEWQQPQPMRREWVMDQPGRLRELNASHIAFDTELTPSWMFGAANYHQVHVTQWGEKAKQMLTPLMQSEAITKVAHNLQHDLAMCEVRFGMPVKPPYFDTYGGAHILNTALERTLSPGISSRFTNWPYHKWLADVDMLRYNGMDNIVCYDAYWEILRQLQQRDLVAVAQHDHKLLESLFAMQMRGFRVSEAERQTYEEEAQCNLIVLEDRVQELAQPIIESRLAKFQKPNLFQRVRKCTCCGGGELQRLHCARCGGLPAKPRRKNDFPPEFAPGVARTMKDMTRALPGCRTCGGVGKATEWLPLNPASNDQVADVVYRGLGIPPRKYKGKETVAATSLEKIQDRHPVIRAVVEASKLRADLTTVQRMTPGTDQRLHCVFDPWGTESGRVAGKEGLLQPGTNPMNIPKKARRFVVPDPGMVFLYPDMAQIEARVVAVLSKKWHPGLYNAFTTPVNWPGHEKHGKIDSHTIVQQMVSQWVQITRDQAKRLTYAVMYGVSAKQLAVELTNEALRRGGTGMVNEAQATLMIEGFFKAFPGVLRWHQDVETQLIQTRTVKSLTGRERHWPGRIMDHKGDSVQRETLKEAWSFVPQDTGAWVLAEGIAALTRYAGTIAPLVHVHDAVLMQVPLVVKDKCILLAKQALTQRMWDMDFPCDMKAGMNWYEASA